MSSPLYLKFPECLYYFVAIVNRTGTLISSSGQQLLEYKMANDFVSGYGYLFHF